MRGLPACVALGHQPNDDILVGQPAVVRTVKAIPDQANQDALAVLSVAQGICAVLHEVVKQPICAYAISAPLVRAVPRPMAAQLGVTPAPCWPRQRSTCRGAPRVLPTRDFSPKQGPEPDHRRRRTCRVRLWKSRIPSSSVRLVLTALAPCGRSGGNDAYRRFTAECLHICVTHDQEVTVGVFAQRDPTLLQLNRLVADRAHQRVLEHCRSDFGSQPHACARCSQPWLDPTQTRTYRTAQARQQQAHRSCPLHKPSHGFTIRREPSLHKRPSDA